MSLFLVRTLLDPPKLTIDHTVALLSFYRVRVCHVGVVQRHLRTLVPEDSLEIGDRAPVVQEIGAESVTQLVRMKLDPQLRREALEEQLNPVGAERFPDRLLAVVAVTAVAEK
jgi:hypothetical protein